MMQKLKFSLFLSFIFLTICSAYTLLPKEDTFSVKDLQSDFLYFRTVLEKAHPSLYRYTPKETLDKKFEEAFAKISTPLTQIEFWKIAQSVCTEIRCGHTSLIRPDSLVKRELPIIPFYVKVDSQKLFIQRFLHSPSGYNYRIGDEILEINHKPSSEIITELRHLGTTEGYSESFRNYNLQVAGFNILHSSIFNATANFNFVLKRGDKIFAVDVLSKSTASNIINKLNTKELDLSYPENIPNTALLKIRRFKSTNFKNDYASIFQDILDKKTENLIIDVRNNPGGKTYAAIELLKYLVPRDFILIKKVEHIVNLKDFISLFQDNKEPSLSTLKKLNPELKSEVTTVNKLNEPYYGKFFNGRIFLLTNGGTFSSASLFSTALKEQLNCIVIGEETGGGNWGNTAGTIIPVTLPKTKIKVNIPLLWTSSADLSPNKGHGLIPDYNVLFSDIGIDDPNYVKYDLSLKKARELIENQ